MSRFVNRLSQNRVAPASCRCVHGLEARATPVVGIGPMADRAAAVGEGIALVSVNRFLTGAALKEASQVRSQRAAIGY